MQTIPHRRQYPRFTAVFSTKYAVQEGKFRDLTRDVGAGGIFIRTTREIKHGQRVNIQFPIFAFDQRLSLMGSVVRCEPEGFAVMFEETMDVKLFKDGQFPGNINESERSTTRIDKHSIF